MHMRSRHARLQQGPQQQQQQQHPPALLTLLLQLEMVLLVQLAPPLLLLLVAAKVLLLLLPLPTVVEMLLLSAVQVLLLLLPLLTAVEVVLLALPSLAAGSALVQQALACAQPLVPLLQPLTQPLVRLTRLGRGFSAGDPWVESTQRLLHAMSLPLVVEREPPLATPARRAVGLRCQLNQLPSNSRGSISSSSAHKSRTRGK
jgi:hypothetical protein